MPLFRDRKFGELHSSRKICSGTRGQSVTCIFSVELPAHAVKVRPHCFGTISYVTVGPDCVRDTGINDEPLWNR